MGSRCAWASIIAHVAAMIPLIMRVQALPSTATDKAQGSVSTGVTSQEGSSAVHRSISRPSRMDDIDSDLDLTSDMDNLHSQIEPAGIRSAAEGFERTAAVAAAGSTGLAGDEAKSGHASQPPDLSPQGANAPVAEADHAGGLSPSAMSPSGVDDSRHESPAKALESSPDGLLSGTKPGDTKAPLNSGQTAQVSPDPHPASLGLGPDSGTGGSHAISEAASAMANQHQDDSDPAGTIAAASVSASGSHERAQAPQSGKAAGNAKGCKGCHACKQPTTPFWETVGALPVTDERRRDIIQRLVAQFLTSSLRAERETPVWKSKSAKEQEEAVDNYLHTREDLLGFWLDHPTWGPDDISTWVLNGQLPPRLAGTQEGDAASAFSLLLWVLKHAKSYRSAQTHGEKQAYKPCG